MNALRYVNYYKNGKYVDHATFTTSKLPRFGDKLIIDGPVSTGNLLWRYEPATVESITLLEEFEHGDRCIPLYRIDLV